MMIQKENRIGEVVAQNFRTAGIFESFGIDFCCGGKRTIGDACLEKGVNTESLLTELNKSGSINSPEENFNNWSAGFLTEYIVNNHHAYVNSSIPVIEKHLNKVASKHGEKHPELKVAAAVFSVLKDDLLVHMAKEEKMLFPYIKQLESAEISNMTLNTPPFGTVNNPVKVMESEHENAGNLMREISSMTNGFTAPDDACTGFRVLYSELKEFAQDLFKHIHLENNVLFPKAKELEMKLFNQITS